MLVMLFAVQLDLSVVLCSNVDVHNKLLYDKYIYDVSDIDMSTAMVSQMSVFQWQSIAAW